MRAAADAERYADFDGRVRWNNKLAEEGHAAIQAYP